MAPTRRRTLGNFEVMTELAEGTSLVMLGTREQRDAFRQSFR